jgi:hypothetical protein
VHNSPGQVKAREHRRFGVTVPITDSTGDEDDLRPDRPTPILPRGGAAAMVSGKQYGHPSEFRIARKAFLGFATDVAREQQGSRGGIDAKNE